MQQSDLTAQESRVRAAVLQRLLHGEALDVASLGRDAGLAPSTVTAALTRLSATGAIYMSGDSVVAAYPFSALPTPHRIRHGDAMVYACCAVDALAVPSMVDAAVTIESHCAHCRGPIDVRISGDRIVASRPDAPLVFHAGRDGCDPGPTVLTRCPLINFFCGQDHADQWRATHPGVGGEMLTLAGAVARAEGIFAATIALVRDAEAAR